MPEYVALTGYQQLMDALKLQAKKNCLIYIYFFGEKDNNGVSWCPDCVVAEPKVNMAFRDYAHNDALIYMVNVGNRETWKDMANNKFRQHPFNLNSIPALLRWEGVERLEGDQLYKSPLLELFFEEAKVQSSINLTVPCK